MVSVSFFVFNHPQSHVLTNKAGSLLSFYKDFPPFLYSRPMKSAVSIAPAAAAKRHNSLCGCAHHIILCGRFIWRAVYISNHQFTTFSKIKIQTHVLYCIIKAVNKNVTRHFIVDEIGILFS